MELNDILIDSFRKMVADRYKYENLDKLFVLDKFITKTKVDEIRVFFLKHVYPNKDARHNLNYAFDKLEEHIKNPSHLLDLLGSGASMIFKFGWQFPQAVRAGLDSLEAYKTVVHFEKTLVAAAIENNITQDLSIADLERLLASLPKRDIRDFIEKSEQLVLSLTNTSLLKKTLSVLTELINKMKSKPEIYNEREIKGFETGIATLRAGYEIFSKLNDKEKHIIMKLIIETEKYHLDRIYKNNNPHKT
jgi:hypothetical protein